MEELPLEVRELLEQFVTTPYYEAYKEYVALEAGKCLGQLRLMTDDVNKDIYIKGQMFGIEKFILDLHINLAKEKPLLSNSLNKKYTKEVLDKSMNGMLSKK